MLKTDKVKNIETANKKILKEEYGGEYDVPTNHKAGLKVPKGGSCCANCKWWGNEKGLCGNKYYIKWNGDGKIPYKDDEYCTDWWEPK